MPTLNGVSFSGVSRIDSPSGSRIDSLIEDAARDNEIIEVPAGEWVIGSKHTLSGGERLGFRGLSDTRNGSRLTTPQGDHEMFATKGGSLAVENVGINQGTAWNKLILFSRVFSGEVRCRTMDMMGTEPNPADFGHGGVSGAFFTCGGGGATLEIVDVKSVGPADIRHYRPGRCFIYGGTNTNIFIRKSDIRNTTNGCGVYGNHNRANTIAEDTYFENCAHSQFRINSRGDVARNCTFVADKFGSTFNHPDNRWSSGSEMNRHIWVFDPKGNGGGKPLVDRCLFYTKTGHTAGVIVDGSGDGARVRNCVMRSDSGAGMLVGHGIEASGGHYSGDARLSGGSITGACIEPTVSVSMSATDIQSGGCTWPGIDRGQPPSGSIPDDGGSGGGGGGGGVPTPTDHTLVIRGEGSLTRYQFTVDGVVAAAGSGDLAGGDFDTVQSNGDGTMTVSGVTGDQPGTGDTWAFDGQIAAFSFTEGSGGVSVDGTAVDPSTDPTTWTPDDGGSGGGGGDGGDGGSGGQQQGGPDLSGLGFVALGYVGFREYQKRRLDE